MSKEPRTPATRRGNHQYDTWIEKATRGRRLIGECYAFTRRMKKRFPELEIVYGWVRRETHPGIRWPHYYLLCPAGHIVDPTRAQFPEKILQYGQWICLDDEPTGYCWGCKRTLHNFEECDLHPCRPERLARSGARAARSAG